MKKSKKKLCGILLITAILIVASWFTFSESLDSKYYEKVKQDTILDFENNKEVFVEIAEALSKDNQPKWYYKNKKNSNINLPSDISESKELINSIESLINKYDYLGVEYRNSVTDNYQIVSFDKNVKGKVNVSIIYYVNSDAPIQESSFLVKIIDKWYYRINFYA